MLFPNLRIVFLQQLHFLWFTGTLGCVFDWGFRTHTTNHTVYFLQFWGWLHCWVKSAIGFLVINFLLTVYFILGCTSLCMTVHWMWCPAAGAQHSSSSQAETGWDPRATFILVLPALPLTGPIHPAILLLNASTFIRDFNKDRIL